MPSTNPRTTLKNLKVNHRIVRWNRPVPTLADPKAYVLTDGCRTCQTIGPCDAYATIKALEAVLVAVDKPVGHRTQSATDRILMMRQRVQSTIFSALNDPKGARA